MSTTNDPTIAGNAKRSLSLFDKAIAPAETDSPCGDSIKAVLEAQRSKLKAWSDEFSAQSSSENELGAASDTHHRVLKYFQELAELLERYTTSSAKERYKIALDIKKTVSDIVSSGLTITSPGVVDEFWAYDCRGIAIRRQMGRYRAPK